MQTNPHQALPRAKRPCQAAGIIIKLSICTIITKEYPKTWNIGDEAYYPINDERNTKLYKEYETLAQKEKNVIFGGRLGMYKYFDMDKVIEEALNLVEKQ